MPDASELMTVPARRGRAQRLTKGQAIKIINVSGTQVCDTWAFNAEDLREFMSMEHMRPTIGTIFPRQGHHLITNRRRPILLFEADTSPGIHDTLIAACDDYRYGLLGCTTYHDNCTDNLAAGMRQIGLTPPETPSPLNLWMNIPVDPGRQDRLGRARLQARRLRDPARRDGLHRRHVRLPPGHIAHQRRQPADHGYPISGAGVEGGSPTPFVIPAKAGMTRKEEAAQIRLNPKPSP